MYYYVSRILFVFIVAEERENVNIVFTIGQQDQWLFSFFGDIDVQIYIPLCIYHNIRRTFCVDENTSKWYDITEVYDAFRHLSCRFYRS